MSAMRKYKESTKHKYSYSNVNLISLIRKCSWNNIFVHLGTISQSTNQIWGMFEQLFKFILSTWDTGLYTIFSPIMFFYFSGNLWLVLGVGVGLFYLFNLFIIFWTRMLLTEINWERREYLSAVKRFVTLLLNAHFWQ